MISPPHTKSKRLVFIMYTSLDEWSEDSLLAEIFLDVVFFERRKQKILADIDKALIEGDKQAFIRLTTELNQGLYGGEKQC